MGAQSSIESSGLSPQKATDNRPESVPDSKPGNSLLLPGMKEQVPSRYISYGADNHEPIFANVYDESAGARVKLADSGTEGTRTPAENKHGTAKSTADVCLAEVQHKPVDMKIDGETRHKVIDEVVQQIKERYVFPDAAAKVEKLLRSKESGDYSKITSASKFADSLSHDVQSVTHDKHLRLFYDDKSLPEDLTKPSPGDIEKELRQQECEHSGIESVQTLPGNIGYLKLTGFFPSNSESDPRAGVMVREAIKSAMTKLANTDALIIDLGENTGGDPKTVQRLLDYLVEPGTNVNNIQWREGSKVRTEPFVTGAPEGPAFGAKKSLFLLTTDKTFSGGEEFAYDLQALGRAKIIGGTTGGGANPAYAYRLTDHFGIAVPTGRSVNPITGTNWEGTGVHPDISASPKRALGVAQVMALQQLVKGATGGHLKELQARLSELNAK